MPAPFQYSTYHSPYTGTILDILGQQGQIRARQALTLADIAARSAEARGEAWGRALTGIGQIAANLPHQIQQQKQAAVTQQLHQITLADAVRTLETNQRVDQTKQRINALMQDPSVFNPDGTLNTTSILARLQQPPAGEAGPQRPADVSTVMSVIAPINESLTATRRARLAWEEQRTNALARMAHGVLTLGAPTPDHPQGTYLEHAQLGLAAALQSGTVTPDEGHRFLVSMIEQPERIPALLQQMVAASTLPPIKLAAGESLVSPLEPSQVLARARNDRRQKRVSRPQPRAGISKRSVRWI